MKNELLKYQKFNEDYVPDCLFPSDNDFEIPTLLSDIQPDVIDIPFVCFGEQRRTYDMNGCGTLHFYTEDYRFNAVFEHPEKILQHNPRNIIEPNFSLFDTTPVSFGFSCIYKKRFIARACQERGIKVFVDLNVSPKFLQLNLLGVPAGWRAFATRGYSDRIKELELEFEVAKLICGNYSKLIFVVYGGGEIVKSFCKKNGCIYITPVIALKNKLKRIEQLNDIAINPFALDISEVKKQMFDGQIENYCQKQLGNG